MQNSNRRSAAAVLAYGICFLAVLAQYAREFLHGQVSILMLRYCVAFCAMCIGGLVAAADVALAMPLLPPHPPRVARQPSPEEFRLVFDACVTCYAVAYAIGQLLYRWVDSPVDLDELRQWSRAHMALLHLAGGIWLIVAGVLAWQQAQVVRPALLVGLVLLAAKLYSAWQNFHKKRYPSHAND